jgi:hypothetical protein
MKNYIKGLYRVAKVIDSNENYDSILAHKVSNQKYANFDKAKSDKEKKIGAINLFCEKIKGFEPKIYDYDKKCKAVTWARTKNNLREIEFFTDILNQLKLNFPIINIADCRTKKPITLFKDINETILSQTIEFYNSRNRLSKSIIHQSINYALAYINFYLTFFNLRDKCLKLYVVANDHSPFHVAFSMVMQEINIVGLYIQHAEVSHSFPNLDFDFSILRNEVSREVYRDIGSLRGMHQIIQRKKKTIKRNFYFESEKNIKKLEKIIVVIYPSAVFDSYNLKDVENRLRDNIYVDEVCLKPHPGLRIDMKNRLISGGSLVLDKIPEFYHIAICGNSSVVVELLSMGFPVYQNFDLDDIDCDYYGFVNKGLVKEIKTNKLTGRFWHDYSISNEWIELLSKYNPAVESSASKLEKSKKDYFLSVLLCAISENSDRCQYKDRRTMYLFHDLFLWPKSFLSLNEKAGNRFYSDEWCIKELDKLFNNREVKLNKLYEMVDLSKCNSIITFWLILKKIEWTGYSPKKKELKTIFDYALSYVGNKKINKWLEVKLFVVLLRLMDVDLLIEFWKKCKNTKVENLHINQKIAYSKFIDSNSALSSAANDHREKIWCGLSEFHKLKIIIQNSEDWESISDIKSHKEVEDEFLKKAPHGVSSDFAKNVIPCYKQFRDKMIYMDVKRSVTQKADILQVIKKKLIEKEPFSLIRLSDGEGYIFLNNSSYFNLDDAKNRERHWWGKEINPLSRREIVDLLYKSVKNADILGIPSIYRFLRDHTDNTKSLTQSLQGRGLLEVLNGLTKINIKNCIFTEDKVNTAIFKFKKNISDLANIAKRVVIISSAKKDALRESLGSSIDYEHIGIPTHYKTTLNKKYSSFERPLPFVYKEILSKIESLIQRGDLVLVAGGVIGKCFINHSKLNGGIAIDMGSAMDEIINAGIHSLH